MRSVCALFLFLIAATARAELTVFAGVEYFNWQEDTTPSVQETGPLFAGGLIWTQDREQGLLFGYRGEIYFGQVNYSGAELFTGAAVTTDVEYFSVLNEGQLRYRFPLKGDEHLDAVLAEGYYDSYRFQQSASVQATFNGQQFSLYQPQSSMDVLGIQVLYSF